MSVNRKHERLMGWAVLVLWAMLIGPSWALALPTLVIQNGILMGANNIDVGGSSYDVRFVEGSCISLFNGCDTDADLTFLTSSVAIIANQALFSQVFTDGILGNFDTQPGLINGCGGNGGGGVCRIRTPYELLISDAVRTSVAQNWSTPESNDTIFESTTLRNNSTILEDDFVYARGVFPKIPTQSPNLRPTFY